MRKLPILAGAVAVGLAIGVLPGRSHHAVQAQFDVNKVVEKHGVLVKIDWINPHTYMHFDVTEDGVLKHYAVESLGILGLRRAGIDSKSAFKVGESFTFLDQSEPRRFSDRPADHADLSRRSPVRRKECRPHRRDPGALTKVSANTVT